MTTNDIYRQLIDLCEKNTTHANRVLTAVSAMAGAINARLAMEEQCAEQLPPGYIETVLPLIQAEGRALENLGEGIADIGRDNKKIAELLGEFARTE